MDTGGLLGPKYSFADELSTPSEIGVGRDGSFDGIMRAVGGVNYYVDAIGFGEATALAKLQGMNQSPLGIRYFIKTGATCSNGADMYEYISTVPAGLQGRVGTEIEKTMGVKFRGLAPGIMGDAIGALNPMPLFQSVIGSGYAQCKKVTMPVGDMKGQVRSAFDNSNVWITDPYKEVGGAPSQTRWVFDKYVTQEQYDAAPKTEKAGTLPETEGFAVNSSNTIAAGVLFAALFLGMVAWTAKK
jgi:hypothetical protein